MDTRQLAAFCAVVEKRSFSQAAERLGVTQPAVSLQIRSLEKRLGHRLLDRSGRRVEPTEAGLRLYASAQRMLELEEHAARGARRGRAGRAARRARDRRLDRARRLGGAAPALRVPAPQPGPHRRALDLRHADRGRAGRAPRARARRGRRGAAPPRRRVRAVLPRRGDPRLPGRAPLRRPHGLARRAARGAADPDAGRRRRPAGARRRAAADGAAAPRPRRAARARAAGVGARGRARRLRRHVHLALGGRGGARSRDGSPRPASRASSRRARSRSCAPPGAPRPGRADAFVAFAAERLA